MIKRASADGKSRKVNPLQCARTVVVFIMCSGQRRSGGPLFGGGGGGGVEGMKSRRGCRERLMTGRGKRGMREGKNGLRRWWRRGGGKLPMQVGVLSQTVPVNSFACEAAGWIILLCPG